MKHSAKWLWIFAFLLNACSINGTFQGLISYYRTTQKAFPKLLVNAEKITNICAETQVEIQKVIITNGVQLKQCIKNSARSVVYIWSPKCKSENCYSLALLQQKCSKEGIELFVVAEYYDGQLMNMNYNLEHPIFAIDIKYYKTNFTSKYLSKFIFDLTNKRDINNRLIYFSFGIFNHSSDSFGGM